MNTSLNGLRVLLADDHAIVRMGYRLLLEGCGAQVVDETDRGEQVTPLYEQHQPDLIVMDLSMPGIGGLAALARLHARCPQARVLILSAHHDPQTPSRALRSGALGYLCKRTSPEAFVEAVACVARGQKYLDRELAQAVALAQMEAAPHPAETLTEKEFAVFLQLAHGRSVQEVADDFHVSSSTVGTHLYHIKQKLQARNAAELAVIAMKAGLLEH